VLWGLGIEWKVCSLNKSEHQATEPMQLRVDIPGVPETSAARTAFWKAFSRTPGVGVSVTDTEGRLIFVNDTALVLFEGHTDVDYLGKSIADFHSPEFTRERIELLKRVVESRKPLIMRHVFLGQSIQSTLWPINDRKPPFNRVIVISKQQIGKSESSNDEIESIESEYIELGQLNVLTARELEVFVMLGHGMGIPEIAKTLFRSPKTIERHKTAIAKKLSLKSQAEMVRVVTLLGLSCEDAFRKRLLEEPVKKVIPDLPI
jgi:DNA-binding CsgD family transcriptional regulator